LPVRYSSTLKKTYFDDYYGAERTRSYLDNLNLLYVALTRAEKGMMVMAPHPTVRNAKNSAAHLLYQGITQSTLATNWNESAGEYSMGSWVKSIEAKNEIQHDAVSLKRYPAFHWRDKLVIRQTATEYFNPAEEKFEKINFGIHLHTILSRISYEAEVNNTLDQFLLDGFITHEERAPLYDQLQELMRIPPVASWFSPEWEVRTETPILLPDGTENRIDRLLINGKRAIIIDFKTGEPLKSDQRQVLTYIEILRKMNFLDVEGYLLYIKYKQVVSVSPGKVKVTKKKDENQISFEF